MLEATYTDGSLVLYRERLVLERWFNGMTEDTLNPSQSVAKSITVAVAGILTGRNLASV